MTSIFYNSTDSLAFLVCIYHLIEMGQIVDRKSCSLRGAYGRDHCGTYLQQFGLLIDYPEEHPNHTLQSSRFPKDQVTTRTHAQHIPYLSHRVRIRVSATLNPTSSSLPSRPHVAGSGLRGDFAMQCQRSQTRKTSMTLLHSCTCVGRSVHGCGAL